MWIQKRQNEGPLWWQYCSVCWLHEYQYSGCDTVQSFARCYIWGNWIKGTMDLFVLILTISCVFMYLKIKKFSFLKMRVVLKSFNSGCSMLLPWLVSASHRCHYSMAHRLYFKIFQIFQRGWGIKSSQNHSPFKNWREMSSSSSSKSLERHSPIVAWCGNQLLTGRLPVSGGYFCTWRGAQNATLGSRYHAKAWLTFGDGYLTASVL